MKKKIDGEIIKIEKKREERMVGGVGWVWVGLGERDL